MLTEEAILALPKLEQHVHIVGSTRPETLLWLIRDQGKDDPLKTIEDVRNFYQYRDFEHFISVYSRVNDYITKERYYERIAYEMLESDAKCNVRHVEAIWSPYDHVRRGLDYEKMLDYINRGIRRAESDFGVTCTIRVDLVRNYGPDVGMKVLDMVEVKGDNIVGIDLGGSEEGYPPDPYERAYHRARDLGLHLVAHAGEASGPKSVWGAVSKLGVERIGHGVAAARDPSLMRELAAKGVAVETCPVSNLRTGAVKRMADHPIRSFIEGGILVSVSGDDPPMFNTDMGNEYLTLHRELGFTVDELYKISTDSIETSFLPEEKKERLRKSFQREYEKLVE